MRLRLVLFGAMLFSLANAVATSAQQVAQEIYQTKCIACHTLGTDRLIGPGLAGVTARRDRAWLKRFIMEPDQVLASDDPIAAELLAEYQVPMLNLGITDAEAEALLIFLDSDEAMSLAATSVATPDVAATEEQVVLGQELFQGHVKFENGGPTCNSCHDVTNDAVIGGGVLAKELTTVFSRLGGPGVRAILGSPPFPVMQRAYQGKGLTEDEVVALVGFLERTGAEQSFHQPGDYGRNLLLAGVIGTALLFGLYSIMWRRRLTGSVNQAIFDRQIKST